MAYGIRHPKKAAFLAAYAKTGNITQAAEIAGCARQMHYDWLAKNNGYAEAFKQAGAEACDYLEREARRRAVDGVDEPVWYAGERCGTVRKYSDTLLIFLMKGAMPEKYRENQRIEHAGAGGDPLTIVLKEGQDVP